MRTNFKINKLRFAISNIAEHKATSLSTALLLSAMPFNAIAAETTELVLDSIEITEKRISDTRPVKGYKAEDTSSATKTNTKLVNVPQAITVITKDLVQDQSVQSISEAVRYVPGVTASAGEGNRDALVFRGNRTTSDLYFDGMRDDIQTYRDLYNTDRIEVLKGPNGMIFGRGGAGGVINRVSKKAGWDPVRDITASYGAYNQKRVSLDIGDAINDVAAFRVNTVYEDSDSYRDGVNIKRYGITPTFTIAPDEDTKIILSMEYFKDERIGDRGVPSIKNGDSNVGNRPYDLGDTDQFFGNAKFSPNETETVAFNGSIEHAFSNGVSFKNNTRYANYDKYYQNVYPNSSVDAAGTLKIGGYRDETKRENLINQFDVTIPFNTGFISHKLLLGNEINIQDTDNKRLTPTALLGLNADNRVSVNNPIATPTDFANTSRNQSSNVSTLAFYAQDQITLSPKWQAVVGVRHDDFEMDYQNKVNGDDIDLDDSFVSPRAGLIFKPTVNTSIYGNYSISYVPRSGDQMIGLTVSTASFKPEKFVNKEVGAKWDITPKFSVTAAVYQLERENLIINDPSINGEKAIVDGQETKGVELSINGNITDRWQIMGGYAYQDAETTKDQVGVASGSQLGETPKHSMSLWNKYKINDMWSVALGITGRSKMYAALETEKESTILAGYTRYDAAIFAKLNDKTSLQINIENLTNKEYALSAHNVKNIIPGSPLTGRATLIYKF